MVTLHDSLLSSSARSLSIRRRPDLIARRQHYLGRSYWVVKDPVGLTYFRFQEEEYALLNWLDGQISLDEIKDRFEAEFPPQKITLDEIQQFLGMLHRSGLVIAAVGGQGKQLLKRRRERRRKELMARLANVLCIRFKGIDPERFLNWLYPWIKWFYSPAAVFACIFFGLSALTLVMVQFQTVMNRLPAFHEFFSFQNALLLSATLGLTKVLHEFGHGMTCKHFGGECHELGVMVLVLTPCLYCNVSDSWLLPNKWQRAAIGAGGMYVELVLASFATWIWWFSEPGLLNHICLNVMFVCSVSTLVFNANPLLRYDGYYILSDITEIPNLRQKSTAVLSRKMGEWLLGLEQPRRPVPARAEPGLLRALFGGGFDLSMGGGLLDLVFPLPRVQALPLGEDRAVDRLGVAVGPDRDAALPVGQVLLCAREARKSEKDSHVHQPGRDHWRAGGRALHSPAALGHGRDGSAAARGRSGLCRCPRGRLARRIATSALARPSSRTRTWPCWRTRSCNMEIAKAEAKEKDFQAKLTTLESLQAYDRNAAE